MEEILSFQQDERNAKSLVLSNFNATLARVDHIILDYGLIYQIWLIWIILQNQEQYDDAQWQR